MAGPFAPSGRRAAARRRTPGGLGPRARPRPRCGLGLGAALRAGLAARASASPPHTPPARLGAADGKAGGCQPCGLVGAPVRALWARPSRPQRPAGRYPCPPWAAWAPPAPRRLRRRCSGPPRPHSWGLLGRCGPPARACLAPACRLAAALPTLGPPGVAAPPRCGVPPPSRGAASAPSGRGPCAAAI